MADKSLKKIELMVKDIPMTFIVGLGRSGTTLLQELMDSHPNVVAPPEYSFIAYLYPRFGKKKHWTRADILEFIEELYFRPIFLLWLIKKEELTERLLAIAGYADYALLCKTIFYQMARGKESVLFFCDKNPENSLLLKTLLKVFPEAKFIHLVREPRDNINSQNKSFHRKNVYFTSRRWKGYNTRIERMKRKMPLRFHTLLYEKLVTDTEGVMKDLCGFLSLPYRVSMVENRFPERLEAMKEYKFYKRVEKMHHGLLSPVNPSNIGKWKKEMTPQNIAVTETITGNLARNKYGYEIREKGEISERVSIVRLIKSWVHYHAWEVFTRMRYKNYGFNKRYYRKKMKSRPQGV